MVDVNILKIVFGETCACINDTNKMITDEINKNKSKFFYLSNEFFEESIKKNGVGWANRYLSTEILQRFFFATITGYLRQHRWIEGIYIGITSSNYLSFAASMRGFLESVTDYYDALYNLSLILAEHYEILNKAIKGEVTDYFLCFKELEDKLLHFQEASRNSIQADTLYKPKTAKSYIENDHLKDLNLYKCYGELCEITHPAKGSLELFFNSNNIISFNNKKDKDLIREFSNRYSDEFSELYMRFENISIINLKLLNLFEIEQFCVKSVDSINTDEIVLWNKIKNYTS